MHEKRRKAGISDTWLTPPWILEQLGPFDLDPCVADKMHMQTAETGYSFEHDGLLSNWKGRIWLNPPYSSKIYYWMEKMALHGNGIALVFARVETSWFQSFIWKKADCILFLNKRLRFISPNTLQPSIHNATAPSCLAAYGADNVKALESSSIPGVLVYRISHNSDYTTKQTEFQRLTRMDIILNDSK